MKIEPGTELRGVCHNDGEEYWVGGDGVTGIVTDFVGGPYSNLAVANVFKGEHLHTTIIIHNAVKIEYVAPAGEPK